MSERRSFYRIIRRMKTFEKDVFHPSSKRNSFLEMKVTFDRSMSGKIFTRQVMAVLQLHVEAEVTSFRRKKKIYWDHSGKIIPFSLSQSQRYVFEVSCCVFERPIMYPVPYIFWLFLIKRLCWLIVCHSSEADVSIISQYPDFWKRTTKIQLILLT